MMFSRRLLDYAGEVRGELIAQSSGSESPELLSELFFEYVLELLDEHKEAASVEVIKPSYRDQFMGKVPAAQLDGWSLSGDATSLDLFLLHFCGLSDQVAEIGLPDLRKKFKLLFGFLKRALDGAHQRMDKTLPAFNAANDIYHAKDTLAQVRLFVVTDAVAKSMDLAEEGLGGVPINYVCWDLEKLSRLRVGSREVVKIDFVNDYPECGGGVPCIQATDLIGEYKTYLAFLPGSLVAKIYGAYGQRLLERNVRAFLQARGKINRGLQRTLREEPHRFLAYNNGLCCTAAEVKVSIGSDGAVRLQQINDMQIVNGGQTTASIFHAVRKEGTDISSVMVQLKLTVLNDQEKLQEIVPLISQYANSQNKVNTADFSANGQLHRDIEALSRTVSAPAQSGLERGFYWYYERARGAYADEKARQGTPAQRTRWTEEHPLDKMFTKTDLAKYHHLWLGCPHIVCFGNQKNFERFAESMADDGEPKVDREFFQHLVAKAILHRTAERIFTSLHLKQFRAQTIAYSVAWLVFRSSQRIDLQRIWRQQHIPEGLRTALEALCGETHGFIRGLEGNPSERCKQIDTWQKYKAIIFDIGDEWLKELSNEPYKIANTLEESLQRSWDRVRLVMQQEPGTLEDLEILTAKSWMPSRRNDPIFFYADKSWEVLRTARGNTVKRLKGLVELFVCAAEVKYPDQQD